MPKKASASVIASRNRLSEREPFRVELNCKSDNRRANRAVIMSIDGVPIVSRPRLIIGISGATGIIYGMRTLAYETT